MLTAKKLILFIITFLTIGIEFFANSNVDFKIQEIEFQKVHLSDHFGTSRVILMNNNTIPHILHECEIIGRFDHFRIDSGLKKGIHKGFHFDDTDVYKAIEATPASLKNIPNVVLEAKVESIVEYFSLVQKSDGYLYTYRDILGSDAVEGAGKTRWVAESDGKIKLKTSGHLAKTDYTDKVKHTFIPYYLWNNHDESQMSVWIHFDKSIFRPQEKMDFISQKENTQSHRQFGNLSLLNDKVRPVNSSDNLCGYFSFKPLVEENYTQYNFIQKVSVFKAKVFWRNSGKLSLPALRKIQYFEESKIWQDVINFTDYEIKKKTLAMLILKL